MKRLAIIALISTLTTPSLAAPDTFIIDNSHTFPSFSYNHLGFSTQISRFNKTSGQVTLDKTTQTGSVDVTIDMKSVDTGSDAFNLHIQGEDFFNTEKYPTATFKSTSVHFDGDKPSTVDGNLTIKGITKPVTLKVTSFHAMQHPMKKVDAIGANATSTIKRSEFNAGKYAPHVGDEITIGIAIEAFKK